MSETAFKKWFEQEGPDYDIAVSSRVRLARNLTDYPFPHRMTLRQKHEMVAKVREVLSGEDFGLGDSFSLRFVPAEGLTDAQAVSLVERHIISTEFAQNRAGLGLLLSKNEAISIMLAEEDHIRIQIMLSGNNLKEALRIANLVDDRIDGSLSYAFHPKLGYLTESPSNLGTGLRASLMLHLPLLEDSGFIGKLSSTVSKLGMVIRGTYSEGSRVAGSFYQLSNQITMGITEESAIENLSGIARQIIQQERSVRDVQIGSSVAIEDRIYRAYGILTHARLMSAREFTELSSQLRLGAAAGIIKNITPAKLTALAHLTGAATIAASFEGDVKIERAADRDRLRAAIIREELNKE